MIITSLSMSCPFFKSVKNVSPCFLHIAISSLVVALVSRFLRLDSSGQKCDPSTNSLFSKRATKEEETSSFNSVAATKRTKKAISDHVIIHPVRCRTDEGAIVELSTTELSCVKRNKRCCVM